MFLAHASSKFPLLFVSKQEETISRTRTVIYLVLNAGTITLLINRDAAS